MSSVNTQGTNGGSTTANPPQPPQIKASSEQQQQQQQQSSGGALAVTTDNNGNRNNNNKNKDQGSLNVSILSAYDLPYREPPLNVSVSVNNKITKATGPPVQRHKDRNSFKFSSNDPNNRLNEVEILAPLPELYESTANIEIVYQNNSGNSNKLKATYPLNQLRIGETTWLILALDQQGKSTSTTSIVAKNNTGTTTSTMSSTSAGAGGAGGTNGNTNANDDDDDDTLVVPTLRLQMTLNGPYRTEIAALIKLGQGWFKVVDGMQSTSNTAVDAIPSAFKIDPKWLLVPAVPVAAAAVVSAPVVAGVLTIGFPLFLPIIVVSGIIAAAIGSMGLATYCSTEQGRERLINAFGPVFDAIIATQSGQSLIYQTGPRPSPVQLTRTIMPDTMGSRLVISLLIDLIGSSSYLIPVAGEAFDISWAPIQTILIMSMYDDVAPNLKYISMVEELLPFTDIVPSASMGWLKAYGVPLLQDKLFNKVHVNHPPTATAAGGAGASTTPPPAAAQS